MQKLAEKKTAANEKEHHHASIDISPLRASKSRVVYSPLSPGDDEYKQQGNEEEHNHDYAHEQDSSTDDGGFYDVEESKQPEKKSRTRSMLQTHVTKGKLEEGLDNDDLKFFM